MKIEQTQNELSLIEEIKIFEDQMTVRRLAFEQGMSKLMTAVNERLAALQELCQHGNTTTSETIGGGSITCNDCRKVLRSW